MVNKLNDGVGKKIVEALKKQSEGEFATPDVRETVTNAFDGLIPNIEETVAPIEEPVVEENIFEEKEDLLGFGITEDNIDEENELSISDIEEDSFPTSNFNNFIDEPAQPVYTAHAEITGADMPANIVILRKLISQLPSGVTRHTGAQIIKQTMEALGISMKSVLKEAQEVQDNLKESAKECQNTIQEYRKQIAMLEKQSQSYQKQYGALNDLISLFIQTTK